MRILLVFNFLALSIGIGYAFRIPEFLEGFVKDRQDDDINDQIIPVFIIAFTASLINSLLFSTSSTAASDSFSWGYIPFINGPNVWGQHYPTCNGLSQSPIDIVSKGVTAVAESSSSPITMTGYNNVRLQFFSNAEEHYGNYVDPANHVVSRAGESSSGTLGNNGHTVQMDVAPAPANTDYGFLSGGPLTGEYTILQLHFHWGKWDKRGSEHTLDGKEFPLELHVVHTRNDVALADLFTTSNSLSVTGFFFEISKDDNPALKPIVDALKNIQAADAKVPFSNSGFRLDQLIAPAAPVATNGATNYRYSTYSGSLTTPGCAEVVHWINFLTPLKISSKQLKYFRTLRDDYSLPIVDNFRPPQPLNGRTVSFFKNA